MKPNQYDCYDQTCTMSIRDTLVQVVSLDYPEWMVVTELLVNRDFQAILAMTACTGSR